MSRPGKRRILGILLALKGSHACTIWRALPVLEAVTGHSRTGHSRRFTSLVEPYVPGIGLYATLRLFFPDSKKASA